ncbi:uncharacterized protein J8A68_006070 [[Candida] subhashii]|uniref:Uncharacterized protein n=1 Tax=[Candida] subhashii TaxID=561895 RepID=A0A8J5QDC9_9ASCO|nr:uncharacterized protein J8A68_006070 [[Candida] subhashii]KAG7660414.1 hypothetical protein J8A68_006070 [[Candida] subhashii]
MSKRASQRLTSYDFPPIIPAQIDDIDVSHAVKTYKPGHTDPKDLPAKLPIYNEATGSIRRFVKRRESNSNSSSPERQSPMTMTASSVWPQKDLPPVPNLSELTTKRTSHISDSSVEEDARRILATKYYHQRVSSYPNPQSDLNSPTESIPRISELQSTKPSRVSLSSSTYSSDCSSEVNTQRRPFSAQRRSSSLGLDNITPISTADSYIQMGTIPYQAQRRVQTVDSPSRQIEFFDYDVIEEYQEYDDANSNDSIFSEPSSEELCMVVNKGGRKIDLKEYPEVPSILPKTRGKKSQSSPEREIIQQTYPPGKPRPASLDINKSTSSESNRRHSRYDVFQERDKIRQEVRQGPFSFCLDIPSDYEYSRFPTVTNRPLSQLQFPDIPPNPQPTKGGGSIKSPQKRVVSDFGSYRNTSSSLIVPIMKKVESLKSGFSPQKKKVEIVEPPHRIVFESADRESQQNSSRPVQRLDNEQAVPSGSQHTRTVNDFEFHPKSSFPMSSSTSKQESPRSTSLQKRAVSDFGYSPKTSFPISSIPLVQRTDLPRGRSPTKRIISDFGHYTNLQFSVQSSPNKDHPESISPQNNRIQSDIGYYVSHIRPQIEKDIMKEKAQSFINRFKSQQLQQSTSPDEKGLPSLPTPDQWR